MAGGADLVAKGDGVAVSDTEMLEEVVRHVDPAFRAVDRERLDRVLAGLRRCEGRGDAWVLAAMRVMALGGNAHSRLIPNAAIRVHPLRFVAVGRGIYLTEAAGVAEAPRDARLKSVNGRAVEELLQVAAPLLAGPVQRHRVIGPLLLAWPEALSALGVPGGEVTEYGFVDPEGVERRLVVRAGDCIAAERLYPVHEAGTLHAADLSRKSDPVTCAPLGGAVHVRMRDFADGGTGRLEAELAGAAGRVLAQANCGLVLDLRGNPGGDFLTTLPFLDRLAAGWRGARCALLVDKFTFSAAIVFAALAKTRLRGEVRLIGELMGDVMRFWAEGDTLHLPGCGAGLRYSTAFHDWETGQADETTPPEIATHLVAAGAMRPDETIDITAADLRAGRDPVLQVARAFLAA